MSSYTTNLDLILYDAVDDKPVTFETYRTSTNGTTSSNMTKIDDWAGTINTALSDLEDNPSITRVQGVLTDDVYTATISTISSYVTGSFYAFSVDTTNTGDVNVNINDLGSLAVMKVDSSGDYVVLTSGDLKLNKEYLLRYDGTRLVWVSATSGDQISMSGTSGDIVTISSNGTLEDSSMTFDSTITADTIPVRNSNGNLQSNSPLDEDDTVTLEYFNDNLRSTYDEVITTQEEFDTLIASDDWLGASSVAFVGDGGTFEYSCGTTAILIPSTVKEIKGFGDVIFSYTGLTYSGNTRGAVYYAELPTGEEYSITGITVEMNGNPTSCYCFLNMLNMFDCKATVSTTTAPYAFRNCNNITNCYISARNASSGGVYGFYECNNIDRSISETWASGSSIAYAFYNCTNISNCHASNPAISSYAQYCYYGCSQLVNCTGESTNSATNSATSNYAFANCTQLANCTGFATGDSSTAVGYTFYECSYMTNCKNGDTPSTTATFYNNTYVDPYTTQGTGNIATTSTLGEVIIGDGLSVSSDGTVSYDLPTATADVLGGVKVGDNLTITDGVLSAESSYDLPTASSTVLGGVKVGSGLSITSDGLLSTVNIDNKIYGIQIDMSNSDPLTSVVYTDDAVGYTQASNTDIGSWQTFLDMLCKPVMLDFNGNVLYDLDKSNQTLKTDGTASDIADETFLGNAMVQFRRLWFKCYTDGSYNYWKFSFTQQDDTWTAYAYQNESGTPQEFIYMPMFNGYIDSSGRMRSISGVVLTASTTATAEQTACQTTGSNWYLETYDMRIMKMGLIWLFGKNLNSQAQFGNGAVSTTKRNTGTQASTGAFAGSTSDNTTVVKTFYCENWWGNLLQRLEGCYCNARVMYVKHSPPFNFTGTGYTEIGTLTSSGYVVNWNTANGNSPYFNNTTDGSTTTYYSDFGGTGTATTGYIPYVGGNYATTTSAGVSYWYCGAASSYASPTLGGSPHLIPL